MKKDISFKFNSDGIAYRTYTMLTAIAIDKLPKNEPFFILNADVKISDKTVYRNEGYCRYNKKYCATRRSDSGHQIYKKKGTIVYIGFDY